MTIPLSSLIYQSIHMYVTIFVCNIYIYIQIHITDTSHCKYILTQYITLYNYMIIHDHTIYIYIIIYIIYILYYIPWLFQVSANLQLPKSNAPRWSASARRRVERLCGAAAGAGLPAGRAGRPIRGAEVPRKSWWKNGGNSGRTSLFLLGWLIMSQPTGLLILWDHPFLNYKKKLGRGGWLILRDLLILTWHYIHVCY